MAGEREGVLRLLLVKTSSMGDLVHTLSALEEARENFPNLVVDWVCEEGFEDIARLSAAVDRVLVVAQRRWRKSLWTSRVRREIAEFVGALRQTRYDAVIDAQGLLKSAWITALARSTPGAKAGFDRASIREGLASLVLGRRFHVPVALHAIERLRRLFGLALGYEATGPVRFARGQTNALATPERTVIFLPGTTRSEKSWPQASWIELGRALLEEGYAVRIAQGSESEERSALEMAQAIGERARPLARLSLGEVVRELQSCAGVIGVDSGLMHLAVYLGRPTVAIMSASHMPWFSAERFAPHWAGHARVVAQALRDQPIAPRAVCLAWQDLQQYVRDRAP